MMKESAQNAPRELFAAANSGKGFANFYPQVFGKEKIEHRYLIKGGPGTGKSTFMRNVAKKAVDAGLDVAYYRCSSDPESLDAIVIAGRIAVMDATSPHSVEAALAGAADELVDLGAFWNSDGLATEIKEIKRLSASKKECYRLAYGFLNSAMILEEQSRTLTSRFIKREKMQKAVARIMKTIPAGEGYELNVGIRSSIGMRGRVRLDTYEREGKTVYLIKDFLKSGSLFISMLAKCAVENGNRITVSYCPLDPDHADAILFEESRIAFVLADGESDNYADHIYNDINMKRFFASDGFERDFKQAKKQYKIANRFCDGLIESAVDALKNAGEYHFELENIYKKYMDFEAQNEFVEGFGDMLVKKLKG